MTDLHGVLILDDDLYFRQTLENIIEVKDLKPFPAATGEQALEIVAREEVAVALIDLRLDQMGGLEVLREIRQRSPYTECILLTGHASRETAIQATNQGAYSYIQKPFKTDELLLTIRRAIEKRSAEKALRESEKRNRAIVRALPDILFRFDAETTFLDCRCNDPEMLLVPPEAFIGQKAAQVLPSFLADLVEEYIEKTLASMEMQVFRYTLQVKGEEHHFETRMVISDEDQILAIVRDISEQVRAEQALRESEQRYQSILENQTTFICRFTPDEKLTFVNQAYSEHFGEKPEEIIGKSFMPKIPEEDREHVREQFRSLTRENPVVTYEHRVISPERDIQWQRWTDKALFNEEGELVEYQSVGYDITEQIHAEREIKERQKYLEALLGAAPDAIITMDTNQYITEWNPGAERLFGYSQREAIGHHLDELIVAPNHLDEARDFIRHVVEGNQLEPVETVRLRKDGSLVYVIVAASPIVLDDELAGIVVVYTDITERVQVEQEIRQQARSLETLVEISKQFVSTLEPEMIFQAITDGVVQLVGLDSAAVYLVDDGCLWVEATTPPSPALPDDSRIKSPVKDYPHIEEVLQDDKPALIADTANIEIVPAEKAYIEKFDLRSVLFLPIRIRDEVLGALVVASSGEPKEISQGEIDLGITLANQAAIAINNAHLFDKIRQHARELEQRVAERTAQLEQSNQDLEAFAYSVSHDLRAPLRHIDGFVQMLADQIDPKSDTVRDYFARIRNASEHMHNLIQALLTYSRVGRRELTFVNVSLDDLIQKVIKRYEPDLEQRKVEWAIEPLEDVYADPYMVEIVFDNLIANAIKFSSHCETARIKISSQPRNGLVDIRVKDNGVGFDMAYADRLFGVFQRLHGDDEFPGTGIGLAIVKRIVRDHNGQVRAQAEPGQGAAFTVSLPKGVEQR